MNKITIRAIPVALGQIIDGEPIGAEFNAANGKTIKLLGLTAAQCRGISLYSGCEIEIIIKPGQPRKSGESR